METFAQWVTFVLRVVGHLDRVLLAASSQNLEHLLYRSAILAPQGNTVSALEVHNLQVEGSHDISLIKALCIMHTCSCLFPPEGSREGKLKDFPR